MKLFEDYGILDLIKSAPSAFTQRRAADSSIYRKIQSIDDPNKAVWVIFLPWRMTFKTASFLKFLPKNNYLVYEMPPSLISPDPYKARETLKILFGDFAASVKNFSKLRLVSFSSSQYCAAYCANHCPVDELILVCPGAKIGEVLWDSAGVRGLRRQSARIGYKSAEAYDHVIGDTAPLYQMDHLPDIIEIHVGTNDKYIRPQHALEYIEALKTHGKSPLVVLHKGKGHLSTMLEFEYD